MSQRRQFAAILDRIEERLFTAVVDASGRSRADAEAVVADPPDWLLDAWRAGTSLPRKKLDAAARSPVDGFGDPDHPRGRYNRAFLGLFLVREIRHQVAIHGDPFLIARLMFELGAWDDDLIGDALKLRITHRRGAATRNQQSRVDAADRRAAVRQFAATKPRGHLSLNAYARLIRRTGSPEIRRLSERTILRYLRD